jgi:ornithine carbamoyltransferase
MKGKDLISIGQLTPEEVEGLLELALNVKSNPDDYEDALPEITMAMIFEKPSLRTRVSFEAGMTQLGGHAIYLGPNDISLGKRESVPDIARTLNGMVDIIMARVFANESVTTLAEFAAIPVINGLCNLHHPCQALADYLTIMEKKGTLRGLKLAFVGDGNNVAHSLLECGAKTGVSVTIVCPEGYEPNKEILEGAVAEGKKLGAKMHVTSDLKEGVKGVDVVYTDVWASMGQEKEAEERKKIFMPYQINGDVMKMADKEAIFMHCLPAHRDEEVTDEVVESWQSVVFDEAENRLHAQKSLILKLLLQDIDI